MSTIEQERDDLLYLHSEFRIEKMLLQRRISELVEENQRLRILYENHKRYKDEHALVGALMRTIREMKFGSHRLVGAK